MKLLFQLRQCIIKSGCLWGTGGLQRWRAASTPWPCQSHPWAQQPGGMVLCPSPRPCLLRRNAHSQRKSVAEETLLSFFNVCVDTYCFSIYSLIYLFTYFGRWYLMHSLYFSFFFLPPTVIVLITHAVEICSNNKVGIVVDLMSNPCFLTQNFHFPQFHYC